MRIRVSINLLRYYCLTSLRLCVPASVLILAKYKPLLNVDASRFTFLEFGDNDITCFPNTSKT